ncbi:(2')5'-bisphosphate nucleotidase 1 [Holotrichia oblita]|uniref:(2')5'-bisphosphate nucleotidase 1 n=2 Tax=Holotrichia oblita TaxID=644536 RepID=A0ACB9SUG2_HOLOL|nr:(2')5'-bisphosphate nucleotidase 1 [Holotrichia oblita]KAI4457882.1 (2')5'-bisphosphate nucleotidase 1 [Holotrichia oblita]
MSLLESLIVVSEKAANIARICRQDRHLFQLLVQEKSQSEANPRFVQDFKTLADVLIQETIKRDIIRKFPVLESQINGEESNTFSNCLGESIEVKVLNSEEATSSLLERVLNGDSHAAELLAEAVHSDLNLSVVNTRKDFPDDPVVNENLSIWIDPIDSTSEYINGFEKKEGNGIYLSGLRCVTVLIGAYDKSTGKPVIGVINQPFYENVEGKWRGKCYWGANYANSLRSSPQSPTGVICISGSEDELVKRKLIDCGGYRLVEAAGAGYKMLAVIEGLADAYILTKNSTFKWDSCGPQAILKCFGGGLIVYEAAVRGNLIEVDYNNGERSDGEDNGDNEGEEKNTSKIEKFCNRGGIIAYNNVNVLNDILKALRK